MLEDFIFWFFNVCTTSHIQHFSQTYTWFLLAIHSLYRTCFCNPIATCCCCSNTILIAPLLNLSFRHLNLYFFVLAATTCNVNGVTYSDGQTFMSASDSCNTCTCSGGDVTCTTQTCGSGKLLASSKKNYKLDTHVIQTKVSNPHFIMKKNGVLKEHTHAFFTGLVHHNW